jgi:serine/threonine-protein kinase
VVLWECLTGRRLHDGLDERQIVKAISSGRVDPPSWHAPGIPPTLDAIVLRGLASRSDARFATALAMAAALENAVPTASSRQLAAWLEQVAGDTLHQRAGLLAAIQGQGEPRITELADTESEDLSEVITRKYTRPPEPMVVRPPRMMAVSEPSLTFEYTGVKWRSRFAALGAILAAAVVIAAGVVLLLFSFGRSEAAAASGEPAPVALAPVFSAGPAVSEDPISPAPSASVEEQPLAPPPAPKPSPRSRKVARSAPVAAKPQPKPSAACNPPYTIDKNGVKRLKTECL